MFYSSVTWERIAVSSKSWLLMFRERLGPLGVVWTREHFPCFPEPLASPSQSWWWADWMFPDILPQLLMPSHSVF